MLVRREIERELKQLAGSYPIVTITGPRQSGKTTLSQMAFPQKTYCSLEDPENLELAQTDPRGFLDDFPKGAILDEVQRAPFLLSYIQGIVDEKKEPGFFILTGSQQLGLHSAVSQTLAGRTALLKLLPFTIAEAVTIGGKADVNTTLLRGFYPRTFDQKLNPTKMYSNYFQTYVERDARQLLNIKDLSSFRKLLRLCAGRVGNLVSFSRLSDDVGVAVATIKAWLSVLEASYIIFFLEPYYENFGKRIVKSPKLYFHDVGLATYLLGIENVEQVRRDPLKGGLFENLVICELLKRRFNAGRDSNLFFFKDGKGNEVDVIVKESTNLFPIEIKSAKTFTRDFLKGIAYFEKIAGDRVPKSYIVYGGDNKKNIGNTRLVPYQHAAQIPF